MWGSKKLRRTSCHPGLDSTAQAATTTNTIVLARPRARIASTGGAGSHDVDATGYFSTGALAALARHFYCSWSSVPSVLSASTAAETGAVSAEPLGEDERELVAPGRRVGELADDLSAPAPTRNACCASTACAVADTCGYPTFMQDQFA